MADEYPAPPCRIRWNRSRMTLNISVTLHHVGAAQINLRTSKNKIELDTLKARRKFKLCKVYPRGIECDDSQTSAKLERNALIVEMPITKLPPPGAAKAPSGPANAEAPAKKTKRKREAEGAVPESATAGGKKEAKPPKRKRQATAQAEDDAGAEAETDRGHPDDAPKPSKKKAKLGKAGKRSQDGADGAYPSAVRMGELIDAASDAATRQSAKSVERMRQQRETEADASRRQKEKAAEKEATKQKLLGVLRQHKAQQKAQHKASASATKASPASASKQSPKSASPKKRVSFSPDV